jgi:hypothetical protein
VALKTQVAAVRTAIKALITSGVPAGTPVYDWTRNLSHEASIAAVMKDTGDRLHFWQFSLAPESPILVERGPGDCNRVRVTWEMHAYIALQDLASPPTEKFLDDEVCDVMDAIEADRKSTTSLVKGGPAQRVQAGAVMLSTVLCNYARLSIMTLIHTEA